MYFQCIWSALIRNFVIWRSDDLGWSIQIDIVWKLEVERASHLSLKSFLNWWASNRVKTKNSFLLPLSSLRDGHQSKNKCIKWSLIRRGELERALTFSCSLPLFLFIPWKFRRSRSLRTKNMKGGIKEQQEISANRKIHFESVTLKNFLLGDVFDIHLSSLEFSSSLAFFITCLECLPWIIEQDKAFTKNKIDPRPVFSKNKRVVASFNFCWAGIQNYSSSFRGNKVLMRLQQQRLNK